MGKKETGDVRAPLSKPLSSFSNKQEQLLKSLRIKRGSGSSRRRKYYMRMAHLSYTLLQIGSKQSEPGIRILADLNPVLFDFWIRIRDPKPILLELNYNFLGFVNSTGSNIFLRLFKIQKIQLIEIYCYKKGKTTIFSPSSCCC